MALRFGGVPEHFNYFFRRLEVAHVSWSEYPGGSGAMAQSLRSGELDVALMLTEAAVAEVSKAAPFKILGAYTSSPLTWGVHAHRERSNTDGWRATRYAVSRLGSGSHLMALVGAQLNSAARPDEFVVVGSLEGARRALAAGEADVFMWEKFTTKPLVDSGEWTLIDEVPTPWPCFAVAVRDDVDPRAVVNILHSVRADADALKASPTAAADVACEYGLREPDVRDWLRTVDWCCRPEMPAATLDLISNSLLDAGILQPDQVCNFDRLVVPGVTADKPLS